MISAVPHNEINVFDHFDTKKIEKEKYEDARINQNYVKDIKHAFQLNKAIAHLIGLWPKFNLNKKTSSIQFEWIITKLKNFVVYFTILFLIVPGILHILLDEHTLKPKLLKVCFYL